MSSEHSLAEKLKDVQAKHDRLKCLYNLLQSEDNEVSLYLLLFFSMVSFLLFLVNFLLFLVSLFFIPGQFLVIPGKFLVIPG